MNLEKLLTDFKNGTISLEEASQHLKFAPIEDVGYAVIDHQRALRNGCPEVIYCAGKTVEQIVGITEHMLAAGTKNILGTRANEAMYEAVKKV